MLRPRTLILIDIAGAFLTLLIYLAIFATDILPTGMPSWNLIFLGIAAALIGSFGAYRLATSSNHLGTLVFLAFLNSTFCIISGTLWWRNFDQLTLLGRLFFPLEIVIIVILAFFELRKAFSKNR